MFIGAQSGNKGLWRYRRNIPILAEAEETILTHALDPIAFLRGSKPHFPVDEVFALAIRASFFIDGPVLSAFDGVAMVGALREDDLAEHAIGEDLASTSPLFAGGGLRTDLENALGFADGFRKAEGGGMGERVAVGTITAAPPHRSERALLTHTAPTLDSGFNAKLEISMGHP